ncbi:GAF domain-containing protein [Mycoplasma sp. NEAQ87857]|uniref:GAF domain-containing protein n=1 Tax=Mycoplasma sp. NEAQ87857 TaxID=2683967 RepID=UPI001319A086|nr:GAF domain-containing protein [Mycoplasma sp. NEAQ87857]QGZ97728.1 GAF domain-containing protein [Mycoplasma sp. NEAQ87857]
MKKYYEDLINYDRQIYTVLANTSAFIKQNYQNLNWVGFYLTDKKFPNTLFLASFQGKVACTEIPFPKGVCGLAATKNETIIFNDVNEYKDHIVCDSDSKSEMVIPVNVNNQLFAVLDIDAPILNRFDQQIKEEIQNIVKILEAKITQLLN